MKLGCVVATTELLAEEVAEHARWALDHADLATGDGQLVAIEAATGRAGQRTNAFLEGFLTEVASGNRGAIDLKAYITDALDQDTARPSPSNRDLEAVLTARGIYCTQFAGWPGFADELLHDREQLQEEIAKKRRVRETYRHERQVRAEAEALLIVRLVRSNAPDIDGHPTKDAFFVSPTRVIDEVARAGRPVTMRPESALHLVGTIQPCDIEELGMFTNALLWELSARSLSVVDERKLLVAFSPLIDASREKLAEEIEHHRALVADRFGEDATQAYADVPPLAAPVVLESLHAQRAMALESDLAASRRRLAALGEQKQLSAKERDELERLRQATKNRAAEGRSAKRAQASRSKSRGKRKRRR
jgi:hypothetical protein